MKFETKIFDEPHLEFGDKHHHPDPRLGLLEAGPLQIPLGDVVKVAVVGSSKDMTNHRLTDSAFIANIGSGSETMVLAGIAASKHLIGYNRNRGNRTEWGVRVDWTGSDGSPTILKRFLSKAAIVAMIRTEIEVRTIFPAGNQLCPNLS